MICAGSHVQHRPDLAHELALFCELQPLPASKKQTQLRSNLLQTNHTAWTAPLSRCRTALRPLAIRHKCLDQLPKTFGRPGISAKAVSEGKMGLLRGVIDGVSAKLAFFPPVPPSYEVSLMSVACTSWHSLNCKRCRSGRLLLSAGQRSR